MTIIHIVFFEFLPTTPLETVEQLCQNMLALETNCVHPTSSKPYIKSFSGGRNNSPEGLSGLFSHAFVVEFASTEDRDYYVKEDPAHQAFVADVKPRCQLVRVMDYEPGVL